MNSYLVKIASMTGAEELCELAFVRNASVEMTVKSQRFGTMSFIDDNWFGALSKFRLKIEQDGFLLLCNAARKDAYPSRMVLEMGGGRKIYLLTAGMPTRREDLVDVLGAASIDQVTTVADQQVGYENWLRSLK